MAAKLTSVSHFVCCLLAAMFVDCHVCLLPFLELVRWDMSHGLRLGLPDHMVGNVSPICVLTVRLSVLPFMA